MDLSAPAHPGRTAAAEPPRASLSTQVLGAVVGAVASAVATSTLGASPSASLVAAVLGAALPPLATVAGPWRRMRLSLALVAVVAGIVLSYGGVKAYDTATESKTLPNPEQLVPPLPPLLDPPNQDDTRPAIAVTPERLTCTAEACTPSVVITSQGDEELEVGEIEADQEGFEGGDECEGRTLAPAQSCTFDVAPTAASLPSGANLVIHSDAADERRVVPIDLAELPPANVAITAAACTARPAPETGFDVSVTVTGPGSGTPVDVVLRLADDSEQPETATAGVASSLVSEAVEPPVAVALAPAALPAGDDPADNEHVLACA